MDDIDKHINYLPLYIAGASAVLVILGGAARLTKTKKDDKVVGGLQRIVNLFKFGGSKKK